jgi:hypothetical protein
MCMLQHILVKVQLHTKARKLIQISRSTGVKAQGYDIIIHGTAFFNNLTTEVQISTYTNREIVRWNDGETVRWIDGERVR